MSLRKVAKELGITPAYLSMMVNGKRPWRADLKRRYDELVNKMGEGVNNPNERLAGVIGAGDRIRTGDSLLGS